MGVTSIKVREEERGVRSELVGASWAGSSRRKEQVAARLQGMSVGRAAVDQREAGQAVPAMGRAQGGERGGGGPPLL